MRPEITKRADALAAGRTPFVLATVVRAGRPASVRPGDAAIMLGDGTIEGFVGGACAESSVRLQALRVLETGEALLLRIMPEEDETADAEGAIVVRNPCLSGGALEIFLEPRLPAPRVAVLGETPIGFALAAIGERLGYDVVLTAGAPEHTSDDVALVVASHGREEEDALASALAAGVPYVGLVASPRRGAAVLEELRSRGVAEDRLRELHTPAGLDIGAATPEEIALSILAEIVQTRRAGVSPPPAVQVDPVCGMGVAPSDGSPHLKHEGRTVYFCGDRCRRAFEDDPARYAAALP
jgi:xanthine dehydrogenase accessory factor